MLTLPEIKAGVDRLASKINAPENLLPTYGYSEDFARPHIEVDSRFYFYVVVERGQELDRKWAPFLDQLLEWIFVGVTSQMAGTYELTHRVKSQDFRRIMFARQIELLALLSPDWANRENERHQAILKCHPFRDSKY